MARSLDVQMDGRLEVWMARCLDGQMDGRLDGLTARCLDVWKARWLEGQMFRRLDGQQGIHPAPVEILQVLFRCITSVKYLFDISSYPTLKY